MLVFNVVCGLASVAGLGISVWALVTARSAKAAVAAFERHEETVRLIPSLVSAKRGVDELRASSSASFSKPRCVTLADDLAQLLASPTGPPSPDLRDSLGSHLVRLRQPKIVRTAETEAWLGDVAALLAKLEAELRSAARRELRR